MRKTLTRGALLALLATGTATTALAAAQGDPPGGPDPRVVDREGACRAVVAEGPDAHMSAVPTPVELDDDAANVRLGTGIVVSPTAVDVERALQPGDAFTCVVTIRNRRTHATTLDLLPHGLRGTGDDEVRVEYLSPGDPEARSTAADWITPARRTIRLEPRGVARIPVTVRVPADGAGGAAYAALHVAPRTPGSDAAADAPNLGIEARIAIPFLMRVGGEGEPKLRLRNADAPRLRWSRASWEWRAEVDNVGTLHATPRGSLWIDTVFGGRVESLTLATRTLLPGGRAPVEARWKRVPWFGLYRYEVRLGDDRGSGKSAHHEGWFVALPPPWLLLAAALTLAALVVARRRRSARHQDRDEHPPT